MGLLRAVLFDLDGTLLDTLSDLTGAVNHALKGLGFPTHSEAEVRSFIGNGAALLISRALPADRQDALDACLSAFKAHYAAHMEDLTNPYPGILPMLDALCARGVRCAVISNKFDGAVPPLCRKYFGERIGVAVGERPGVPRKPAPDATLNLMAELGVDADATIYVGDSDTDVQTAHNAGLRVIGVTWGFQSEADLVRAGADAIAHSADELLLMLLRE